MSVRITNIEWLGAKPPHLRPWWQRPLVQRIALAVASAAFGAALPLLLK